MAWATGSGRGPLSGVRVFDLSGLGPAPFATMMLADFGASVLSVCRPDPLPFDTAIAMSRGKDLIGLDLRTTDGQALARRLAGNADVLVEGFRPGVMERLGLGPEMLHEANPGLIHARLTGWGQTGPYAKKVGHDINYLAVSGMLGQIGEDRPTAPPTFLGDLANGAYTLVIGIMLALFERQRTGKGQVVDAAIVDGAAYMLGGMFGGWRGNLKQSMLGGAAPFYGVYECADGRWFSIGAIEPKFYAALLDVLALDDVDRSPQAQHDQQQWPKLRARIAAIFRTRTMAEWTDIFAPHEVCAEPVLDMDELPDHPHLAARGSVRAGQDDTRVAAPAPRLSGHPELVTDLNERRQRGARDILAEAGLAPGEIDALLEQRVVWSV